MSFESISGSVFSNRPSIVLSRRFVFSAVVLSRFSAAVLSRQRHFTMPLNLVNLIADLPAAWVTIQLFCYEFIVQAMITKIDDSVKFGSWLDEFHKKCFFICHIVKMQDSCVQVQSTAKLVKQLRDMICAAILAHVPGAYLAAT